MAYGIINDQITVTISWEYFHYGKGLFAVLGDATPPAELALRWEAAKVGMKATWTAGLLIGAAVLMANSLNKKLPRLNERELYPLVIRVIVPTLALALAGGLAGRLGLLTHLGGFEDIVRMNLWRPARFMSVWGIHLGGYVGGGVGMLAAVLGVIRRRKAALAVSQ